ncbi:MAG: SusD/RagB family nutrient-binding outer membrane lipoprotein [Ferruginibacter sp.]|nr:SusD/RagB family nutrient-binding outer membrane lipoprotein [Cytophagales bacterium]
MKVSSLKIFLLTGFLFTACDRDFEEINANPNNPEAVNPELLLVTVIRSTVNSMVNEAFSTGNVVAQFAAEIREPGTDRYLWGSFGTWDNGYGNLRDVNNLYAIATERNLDQYRGIALVMKSLIFARMTDCYGDLPYAEALQGKAEQPVYAPRYDRQQDIYAGILAELTEANRLLAGATGTVRNDILYNGDVTRWRRLANSLRLRLLLRQSNRVDPSAAMREIMADPGQSPLILANADNAVLRYVESPNLYPLTGQRSGFFLDRRLSKTLADRLNATRDPRLAVYAQPTTESKDAAAAGRGPLAWAGVRNGELDANLGSSIDRRVSPLGDLYYRGLQVAAPAQGLVMTAAETNFILAEAAQRGWIVGNPETYYLNGIRASIDYYRTVSGVNLNATPEYLSQSGVAFEAARALELIGTQKWIALYFNDLQAWHEWKRTGIPALAPSVVNNNSNQIPVRFRYPTDQQVTNRTSYEEAVARQGPDDINTKVWWDGN